MGLGPIARATLLGAIIGAAATLVTGFGVEYYRQRIAVSNASSDRQVQVAWSPVIRWTTLRGYWDPLEDPVTFTTTAPDRPRYSEGLILAGSEESVRGIRARVQISRSVGPCEAQLVFGYDPETGRFFAAGLGGSDARYVIGVYEPDGQWRSLAKTIGGGAETHQLELEMALSFSNGRAILKVNGAEVLSTRIADFDLRSRNPVGLFVRGCEEAYFRTVRLQSLAGSN